MPLYEYACDDCHHREDHSRSIAMRDGPVPCGKCGKPMRRCFNSFRFRFRPRGWKPYTVEGAAGAESVDQSFRDGIGRPIADPRQ